MRLADRIFAPSRRHGYLLIASAAALAASPATAVGTDTAQLELHGVIEPKCAFTTTPSDPNLGVAHTGDVTTIGSLGFTCNMANGASVNLTIKSDNGALQRDGATDKITYAASWNVAGTGEVFYDMADYTTPHGFTLPSANAGTEQSGVYKIKITGATASAVAGTYRDVITYTISP